MVSGSTELRQFGELAQPAFGPSDLHRARERNRGNQGSDSNAMRQGWIQIAGLVFDITGFLLIVTEWWNAVIRERAVELFHTARRYEKIALELSQSATGGTIGGRLLSYLIVKILDEKDRALTRAEQLASHDPVAVFRRRLRNFLTGATLVVLGFLLQVASAIPGGMPTLGILP